MSIKEIEAKSILKIQKKIDSWFISRYGMNLYRGCMHNCTYCDGRAEGYYLNGQFGRDVEVKINAPKLLQKELGSVRKKLKPSYVMLSGGVGDSYQPIDEKYQLSRKVLQLILEYNLPVHVLTKSTLVERDIDILKAINKKTRAIVSFSFSSVDNKLSHIFEPGVPLPEERLRIIKLLKKEGLTVGMFLLPVIPFITDNPKIIDESIKKGKDAGLDFIIFGGMTLKKGRQKEYFMDIIRTYYPGLVSKYENIYLDDKWGHASEIYYKKINHTFYEIAKKYNISKRVPLKTFRDILDDNDLVVVLLEHIDYLLKIKGKKSNYGSAAYSISKLEKPLSFYKNELTKIKGVGPKTEKIILEILERKNSTYYQELSEE